MSFGSVGMIGYGDDQELQLWDRGTLDYNHQVMATGMITSPTFNVSNWHSVFWQQFAPDHDMVVTINFTWTDVNPLNIIAQRTWHYDGAALNPFEINLDHFGPYMYVTVTPQSLVTPWRNVSKMILNNRDTVLGGREFGILCDSVTENLAASASYTQVFSHSIGGRLGVYIVPGTQGVNVSLQQMIDTLAYREFWSASIAAAGAPVYAEVLCPLNSCRFVLTNPSAVATSNGCVFTTWLGSPVRD